MPYDTMPIFESVRCDSRKFETLSDAWLHVSGSQLNLDDMRNINEIAQKLDAIVIEKRHDAWTCSSWPTQSSFVSHRHFIFSRTDDGKVSVPSASLGIVEHLRHSDMPPQDSHHHFVDPFSDPTSPAEHDEDVNVTLKRLLKGFEDDFETIVVVVKSEEEKNKELVGNFIRKVDKNNSKRSEKRVLRIRI